MRARKSVWQRKLKVLVSCIILNPILKSGEAPTTSCMHYEVKLSRLHIEHSRLTMICKTYWERIVKWEN